MIIRPLITGFLIVAGNFLCAQNAPVTTAATVSNAISGQEIVVPITVTGFTNIGSIALTMEYDSSKLHFVSGTQNPLLSGNFCLGDNDLGTGMRRIMLGWYGPGVSLPDGTWIANYVFTYFSGTPSLQWHEMGPSCDYTDADANILNDSPASSYYINGLISGVINVNTEKYLCNTFQVFPNPATDLFFIKTSGPPDEFINVNIFSSYGRFLKKYEFTGGPFFPEYRIDIRNFESGVYLIMIENGKKCSVQKLTIL